MRCQQKILLSKLLLLFGMIKTKILLFLKQVKIDQGIPFKVRIPNTVTKKTFDDTDKCFAELY